MILSGPSVVTAVLKLEAYKAVVSAGSDTNYVAVKYNFCPICGKRMGV